MGLLQKAVETYDSHLQYASQNREGSSMMAPVAHIVTRADLEITLDDQGVFVDAALVDKAEPKIIIPATESSAGRTSAPCAHPLCDQIGYLTPANGVKYKLYTDQLTAWADSEYSHPKLGPILTYVKRGQILSDLVGSCSLKLSGSGRRENEKQVVR